MNAVAVEVMTASNAVENCARGSASCSHVNTKKVAKFGKKCAICHTRVWKFWKTRKCRDCKIILHKSCMMAARDEDAAGRDMVLLEEPASENAGGPSAEGAIAAEASAISPVQLAPMYRNPRPWTWENVTMVVVDCRRRPRVLTVNVSHGRALATSMFACLFGNPLTICNSRRRRRRQPTTARSSTPPFVGLMGPLRSRPLAIEWKRVHDKTGDVRRPLDQGDA